MFQPQPTPLASSCFASPFAFQPASASPATASSPAVDSNSHGNHQLYSHDPHPGSAFIPSPPPFPPNGLSFDTSFGFYFPPVALGGGGGGPAPGPELAGLGSGAGARAGAGGRTSRGPTPPAPSKFTNNATGRSVIYGGSRQSDANASTAPRYIQARERQHAQSRAHPPPRQQRPSPIKMEDQQDPHGMAAQQAAAQDYQPELPVSLGLIII